MVRQCASCLKPCSSLRHCVGCSKMYYCSNNCQKRDWINRHKSVCEVMQKISVDNLPLSEENRKCTKDQQLYGNATENIQGKGRVESDKIARHLVKVSSDLRSGKTIYEEFKMLATDDSDHIKTCHVCGKSGEKVDACGENTSFCSQDAKSRDWPYHKQHPNGFPFQNKEIPEHHANIFSIFGHNFHDPSQRLGVDLNFKAAVKEGLWDKAVAFCTELFPSHTVVSDLDRIPDELSGVKSHCKGIVFVAFISRYHHYRMRHCVYIEDEKSKEMYVAFYLELDNPLPYFRWKDVIPGNFICIEKPFRHYFVDGSVGIRVDEAENVQLLPM